jgi:hypothetical protein
MRTEAWLHEERQDGLETQKPEELISGQTGVLRVTVRQILISATRLMGGAYLLHAAAQKAVESPWEIKGRRFEYQGMRGHDQVSLAIVAPVYSGSCFDA